MSNILETAEQLNKSVTTLNMERNKLEGMLESARSNYDSAVKSYKELYGVDLTDENLQAEYNKVYAEVQGAMLDLQEKIESIRRGDYKKDVEEVSFELEPTVEPIREESKVEKKRGRKPKATKKDDISTNVLEDAAVVNTDGKAVNNENGGFDLPQGPISFGTMPTMDAPKVETPPAPAVEPTKAQNKSKVISPEMLNQAVASANSANQHPISLGLESDDEVDLSTLNGGNVAAPTIAPNNAPTFGGFGDFSSLGVETKKDESTADSAKPTFGDFGGFGGFGGLDDAKPIDSVAVEGPKAEKKDGNNADLTQDWGNFGNLDFGTLLNSTPKFGE